MNEMNPNARIFAELHTDRLMNALVDIPQGGVWAGRPKARGWVVP